MSVDAMTGLSVSFSLSSPSCHCRCKMTDFVAHYTRILVIYSGTYECMKITVICVPFAANHLKNNVRNTAKSTVAGHLLKHIIRCSTNIE
jgi:hypothetical protein